MERIPLCIPALGDEEVNAVEEVLRNGWLAHGPKNHEFEELFQKHLNVKHAITMNSCTSALHIALEALNIQGEVITPSFTWVATVNAIILAGATPIFVDI
ncbi:MAG: DegT/DnrJ/EryC1/StrS family aminotransferase, partial [Candidatus Latescibacterota bacterium]